MRSFDSKRALCLLTALALCAGQDCTITVQQNDAPGMSGDDGDPGHGDPSHEDPAPTAPTFTFVPDELVLDCTLPDASDTLSIWLESAAAEADSECGDVDIAHEVVGLADTCEDDAWTLVVEWTATDECELSSKASAQLKVLNPGDAVIELIGESELTLECGVDTYEELGAMVTFGCEDLSLIIFPDTEVDLLAPGVYELTYALSDECDHAVGPLTRTVTVVDTLDPELTRNEILELWPPNHQYSTVRLSDFITIVDACEGELDVDALGTILSISSDEPENSNGDGNTTDDIAIVDHSTANLRVERRGGGNGRVYTIDFEIDDGEGFILTDTAYAHVPHDQSGDPAGDDGPSYTITPE